MKKYNRVVLGACACFMLCAPTVPLAQETDAETVKETYLYTLGRMLALRQEHIDFDEGGYQWNVMFHREPGNVSWANPNLDVAYMEAWVAVDETSCTLVQVPEVAGRYYTVQFLDPWGEVTANLNERAFPEHPHGTFAMCLEGAQVDLPADALRVDLPSKKSRILGRVELKGDPEGAVALLKQFTLTPTGNPEIDPAVEIPNFTNEDLMGIELYEAAQAVFASAPDPSVSKAAELQAETLSIAAAAKDSAGRAEVEKLIETVAKPAVAEAVASYGTIQGGWSRTDVIGAYGDDYVSRTVVNLIGIWANSTDEVIYYTAGKDADGAPLDGTKTYTIDFEEGEDPSDVCTAFWSVTVLRLPDYLVVENPLNRWNLNNVSPLEKNADGTLTIAMAPEKPESVPDPNWIPTPREGGFSATFRCYRPVEAVRTGAWFAPPIVKRG
jgi:hypothetical protein